MEFSGSDELIGTNVAPVLMSVVAYEVLYWYCIGSRCRQSMSGFCESSSVSDSTVVCERTLRRDIVGIRHWV